MLLGYKNLILFCFSFTSLTLNFFITCQSFPQPLINSVRRLYRVFGSGASHAPYAQFSAEAKRANNGKPIGLLRGASSRMATFFYAMHRLLRLKKALLATIHSHTWNGIKLTDREKRAVRDIENNDMWQRIYILLLSMFPALRVLQAADSNQPCMEKLYYLCHRTT